VDTRGLNGLGEGHRWQDGGEAAPLLSSIILSEIQRVSLQATLALRTCPSNVEGHGSWHISRCDHLTPRVSRLMARCPELPVSPHCIGPSDRSAPKVSGRLWTFINGRLPIFAAKILS
jgi:hypothetical protein